MSTHGHGTVGPRRVVHVMRRFVPSKWGGTESVVFHLAREFQRLGVESPIYATSMFAAAGRETFLGVPVHRFPYVLPWLGLTAAQKHSLELKGGSPFSWGLWQALRRDRQATHFHAHVQHRLGGSVREAARHLGIPYAVSIHGGHHTLPQEQTDTMLAPTRGKLEWGRLIGLGLGARRVLDDAGVIFCVGREEHDAMARQRPSQPVHYQPNGVDVQMFRQARAECFWEKFPALRGRRIILCVSRVDPQKNQLLLLRAFAEWNQRPADAHLVLIGPEVVNSYGNEIRKLAGAAGLGDRMTWIPGLSPDDPALPGAFRAASCFVLPSVHEPFGIVILEAWAAGLPVVAARVGGIPGFSTDGSDILHFPSGNAGALIAALQRLHDEPGLADRLKTKAGKLVEERYDWPAVARRVLELYPPTSV